MLGPVDGGAVFGGFVGFGGLAGGGVAGWIGTTVAAAVAAADGTTLGWADWLATGGADVVGVIDAHPASATASEAVSHARASQLGRRVNVGKCSPLSGASARR